MPTEKKPLGRQKCSNTQVFTCNLHKIKFSTKRQTQKCRLTLFHSQENQRKNKVLTPTHSKLTLKRLQQSTLSVTAIGHVTDSCKAQPLTSCCTPCQQSHWNHLHFTDHPRIHGHCTNSVTRVSWWWPLIACWNHLLKSLAFDFSVNACTDNSSNCLSINSAFHLEASRCFLCTDASIYPLWVLKLMLIHFFLLWDVENACSKQAKKTSEKWLVWMPRQAATRSGWESGNMRRVHLQPLMWWSIALANVSVGGGF